MASPYTVRWGILATGMIATTFAKDLLIDPSTRSVTDVRHEVVAAASSTSAKRARDFLQEVEAPTTAVAYGSYDELAADRNVDIIYISTPHSHHFQNAMLCLNAGKHVLCEKPLTVNAAQTRVLIATAKKKALFLMEAVWTRFFPLSVQIRDMVSRGDIGKVHRVFADFSFGGDPEQRWGTEHRAVNMDLAGGALLDLGIYSLTWVFQILYHLQPRESRRAPRVLAAMAKYDKTGADDLTSVILDFESSHAHGIATTGLRVAGDPDDRGTAGPAVRIQGTTAEIQVSAPAFGPTHYRIIPTSTSSLPARTQEIDCPKPGNGHGMFWEADACARCLRDGKTESEIMTLEESETIMEVMDQVREQGGLRYPEWIESTGYNGSKDQR